MNDNNALVIGSLAAIAKQAGHSLAESFIGCDIVILLDVSGSMDAKDARGDRRRYDIACDEMTRLQADLPGRCAVIGFSAYPEFAPNGKPRFQAGTTDLAKALQFAKAADVGGVRFVIISDGQPDSEREALAAAAKFQGRIDCIYIGPEGDRQGRDFLDQLANAHGGTADTVKVHQLAAKIERLLLTA